MSGCADPDCFACPQCIEGPLLPSLDDLRSRPRRFERDEEYGNALVEAFVDAVAQQRRRTYMRAGTDLRMPHERKQ